MVINNQRILITGSSGMVGKNFLEEYNNLKIIHPSKNELNLFDKTKISNFLKKNKINVVLHLAAKVGGIQDNINFPIEYLTENIKINHNIIMSSFENNIKFLLNIGSSCAYPKNKKILKENMIFSGSLEPSNESYAISKIFSLKLCSLISKKKNYFYKSLVPCNLYGPYDKFENDKSHLVAAIIDKVHKAKVRGAKTVDIWGDGKAKREFMFVKDFTRAIFFCLSNIKKMPVILNCGTGEDKTILEYYKVVSKTIYPELLFKHILNKPVGMEKKLMDVKKINKFGWKANTSFDSGVTQTYNYYLNNCVKK
jgi:GDP-L-fucose synthase